MKIFLPKFIKINSDVTKILGTRNNGTYCHLNWNYISFSQIFLRVGFDIWGE